MKKTCLVLILVSLSMKAHSQDSGIGVGVFLGDPMGFCAKMWVEQRSALVAAAGYDFRNHGGGMHINVDFHYHHWSFDVAQGQMLVYFGPGIGLGLHSEISIVARAPGGITYHFQSYPLEIFFEIVPALEITGPEGTKFWIGSYIGARWYF